MNPRLYRGTQAALPQDQCSALDSKVTGWTAASIVVGTLGGSSGVATTVLADNVPRWVTGSVTVFLSAMAGLSGYLAGHYAAKYSQGCTVPVAGSQ